MLGIENVTELSDVPKRRVVLFALIAALVKHICSGTNCENDFFRRKDELERISFANADTSNEQQCKTLSSQPKVY